MQPRTWPRSLVGAVGDSPLSGKIARAQGAVYAPFVGRARRSPLHSGALGHSMHPPLTHVVTGCWIGASLLDVAGGTESRRGAALLTGCGVLAVTPTALAGAADWAELSGRQHRVGAVHALGADVATAVFAASLVARLQGRHRLGAELALAGNVVMGAAGFLGGHLALHDAVARRPFG